MTANELRIGNLILVDGEITEITGVKKSTVFFSDGFQMFIAGGLEPIPLTEEWLIKFGLNKTVDHPARKLYENDDICPLWFSDKKGINDFYASRVRICECKYVHQLQNLYFALTGEELTIDNEETK